MTLGRWLPLIRLLQRGPSRFDRTLLWMAALSGLANAGLLATINAAADNSANAAGNGRLLTLFAIVTVVFLRAQRYILLTSVAEVERILDEIRRHISGLIARADLRALEGVGRAQIYASLHRETVTISQATSSLVIAAQSTLMVAFSLIYLGWLSGSALVLMLLAMAVAIRAHLKRAEQATRRLHDAQATENEFFDGLTHLLDGFKEVKLRRERAAALADRLSRISRRLQNVKVQTGASFAMQFVYGQLSLYLLLGAVVFLLPRMSVAYSDVVIKATASILFIVGPLTNLLSTMPFFSAANVAAESIASLEQRLEQATQTSEGEWSPGEAAPADTLRLRDVVFRFTDGTGAPTFTVGPLSLTVPPGEILFIVGGNGSGKSTLLKLLAGLYAPDEGTLQIGSVTLTPVTAAWYRSHFAAVFSDYHLFDRLYGVEAPAERLAALLATFEMGAKTGVTSDGRFTSLDLSAGQRKRLALMVALLEERPILVTDEWAADQDPEFRRFFYEALLPRLKAAGTTIIAATHDDRYFHTADRVLKMEDGRFVEFTPPGAAGRSE